MVLSAEETQATKESAAEKRQEVIAPLDEALYAASFTAGMNQRYHQHLVSVYVWCDRGVKIAVLTLTVATLVTTLTGSPFLLQVVLGILGTLAAIVLTVLPISDTAKEHAEHYRRWSDLREDAATLSLKLKTADPLRSDEFSCLASRIIDVEAKVHRACAAESPSPWKNLLDRCYAAEEESRKHAAVAD
jgi:hypothetical protein